MRVEKNKIKQVDLLLRIIFVVFFVCSSVYQIRYGAGCDMASLTSWASRTAKGDFPLVDTWGPYCVLSWLVGFIYRIIYLFDENFTYSILVIKILGVCFQVITMIYFYSFMKKKTEERQAFWASAILVLFIPYYMYIFVSHYTISYWLSIILAIALLNIENHTTVVNSIIISLILILSILAMPMMIVMFLCVLIYIWRHHKKNIQLLLGILLCSFVVMCVGIFIFYIHGGTVTDILNILNGGQSHEASLFSQICKRAGIIIPLGLLVILYSFIVRRIGLAKYELPGMVCILFVGSIGIWIITGEYSQLMRSVFFSDIVLGIWSCINWKDTGSKEIFSCFAMVGCVLATVCALSTNTGVMVASIGLIIPFGVYVALYKKFTKITNVAVFGVITLIFIQRITIADHWSLTSALDCTTKIEVGCLKGVYVQEQHANKYNRIYQVINKNVTEDDNLLLYGGDRTFYYGYTMTNAVNAGNSVDDMEDDYRSYQAYYMQHPERIPTIIIIPGTEYTKEISETDTDFMSWVKSNYYLNSVDGDYMILKQDVNQSLGR